jgi:hypothetical protein
MGVQIEIKGLDKIVNALQKYPQISRPLFVRAINASLITIESVAHDPVFEFRTPRGERTGLLEDSFAYGKRLAAESNLSGSVGPTVRYAKFVEEGTSAHTITVRNKKVLANKKTGEIFGRTVHHPGTPANPFMERIADRATPKIQDLFAQTVDKLTQQLCQ